MKLVILLRLVLNDARVVHKVTIVPRGRAGGYAIMLPREDQMLLSKKDAMEQIAGLMGGRTAEDYLLIQNLLVHPMTLSKQLNLLEQWSPSMV